MTRNEFVQQYTDMVKNALYASKKARTEGLLALEEELDHEMVDSRDIFAYGIRFVIDGVDQQIVDKILSNIVSQEKDEQARILKTIQKEAVLAIQEGMSPRIVYALLNSYADISIKDDEIGEKSLE
jgi:flagellar motor component MotA